MTLLAIRQPASGVAAAAVIASGSKHNYKNNQGRQPPCQGVAHVYDPSFESAAGFTLDDRL